MDFFFQGLLVTRVFYVCGGGGQYFCDGGLLFSDGERSKSVVEQERQRVAGAGEAKGCWSRRLCSLRRSNTVASGLFVFQMLLVPHAAWLRFLASFLQQLKQGMQTALCRVCPSVFLSWACSCYAIWCHWATLAKLLFLSVSLFAWPQILGSSQLFATGGCRCPTFSGGRRETKVCS